MNIKLIKYFSGVVIIVLAVGCIQHNHDDHSHGKPAVHADGEHHEHSEQIGQEEVHLVQKQMDVMGIELGNFQYLNLSTTVKANGQLELPPQNKASLGAIMGGRVKTVNVLEGDYVVKGQILASLEHPDFVEMQEQYMGSKSQLVFLEKE